MVMIMSLIVFENQCVCVCVCVCVCACTLPGKPTLISSGQKASTKMTIGDPRLKVPLQKKE